MSLEKLPTPILGRNRPTVSAIGLRSMGELNPLHHFVYHVRSIAMSAFYGKSDDEQSLPICSRSRNDILGHVRYPRHPEYVRPFSHSNIQNFQHLMAKTQVNLSLGNGSPTRGDVRKYFSPQNGAYTPAIQPTVTPSVRTASRPTFDGASKSP